MDPSRNMSKYRNLVNSEMVQAPLVSSYFVVDISIARFKCAADTGRA